MNKFRLASLEDYEMLKKWYRAYNDHDLVYEATGGQYYIMSIDNEDVAAMACMHAKGNTVAITGWLMLSPLIISSELREVYADSIIEFLESLARDNGAKCIMSFTDSYAVERRHMKHGYHTSGKEYLRLFKWIGV